MGRTARTYRQGAVAVLLAASLFMALLCPAHVQAAPKRLTLETAQDLAVAASAEYRRLLNKIEIQKIKYATAVKSIRMKKQNMSTFRWTPLLSFHFPEKPTLADEYEWQYKPLQITCVTDGLRHQLTDTVLASRESVSLVYVETYVCQEKIRFYEDSLAQARETLHKDQIRLIAGAASQADIDKMQQNVSRLTTELALQMRTFEAQKSRLSDLTGLDVTSGYTFADPFIEADIPRSILEDLIGHTLDNDQGYYEAKLDTALSLASLTMMERMMRAKYGRKMDKIAPYIRQAMNGDTIDSAAFRRAYDQMLADIDAPWDGSIRILFIKIDKEWFKGAVAGSRYVEDDPYALYTGALEYADAVREQQSAKKALEQAVRADFETVRTAQVAYADAVRARQELEEDLEKGLQLNRLGQLAYEELADIRDAYEEQELETLELLAEYSRSLYAYDRLTCGGITAYLTGTDLEMAAAQDGNSYLADEMEGTAYYHIGYAVQDNLFRLGVSIPEDFSVEITHFELYVDGNRIGDRTAVDSYLEHLALDLDSTQRVELYLYEEEELADICEIDPSVYQDVLDIRGGYTLVREGSLRTVADYTCRLDSATGLASLVITPRDREPIAFYHLEDGSGNIILGQERIAVGQEFRYLGLLSGDLSGVWAVFYDASGELLYRGIFETGTGSIVAVG